MIIYNVIGAASKKKVFTEVTWPIHIKDLNCTGSENSIWDCPHNRLKDYYCNHHDDAAVMCQCNYFSISR